MVFGDGLADEQVFERFAMGRDGEHARALSEREFQELRDAFVSVGYR
jgi:hypothetical protein